MRHRNNNLRLRTFIEGIRELPDTPGAGENFTNDHHKSISGDPKNPRSYAGDPAPAPLPEQEPRKGITSVESIRSRLSRLKNQLDTSQTDEKITKRTSLDSVKPAGV